MRPWIAAFVAGPALLLAAALIIPAVRSRPPADPVAGSGPTSASVPPVAQAGRLRVTITHPGSGPPAFGALTPAPEGVRLAPPGAWPLEFPSWQAPEGTEVTFLLTVAPDGTFPAVAPVGAPTVPHAVVEALSALLRQSRFIPYESRDTATVALIVRLEP